VAGRGAGRYPRRVKADPDADLLPGEWAVLGVLALQPAHGFAVARTLAPEGELGRVWTMSRPRVYRAINDLNARGLIAPAFRAQSERGPTRVLYAATETGRDAIEAWLATPVDHVRDVRSDLLLKLALLHAAGRSADPLLEHQRALLQPVLESLQRALAAADGFDAVVLRYRVASICSVLDFLRDAGLQDAAAVDS
jgi:DNA-binding PadR family transcriptional regulator